MNNDKSGERIIIAEKDKDFLLFLSAILESAGYSVIKTDTPAEAVEHALNDEADLILMDIDPSSGMDGAEAASGILSIKSLPVIFLATVFTREVMEKVRGITCYGYVLKNSGEFLILSSVSMAFEMFKTSSKLSRQAGILSAITDSIPIPLFTKDINGVYLDVNNAFASFYGRSKKEMTGKTVFEVAPPELAAVYHSKDRELFNNPGVQNYESRIMDASSNYHDVIFSKATFNGPSGDTAGLVGIILDVTENRKAGRIIDSRLRLMEYSLNHTLDEVLQKTLDEVTDMSDSLIGFYHFVSEEEKTITLQGWSTRTLAEFCRAEGKGMHYSIDRAGVWADAIRERKPVIHNDYPSLPNRKGMPQGHAGVIRELVVPIFRNDRIVAILGVGNKAADYTDGDVQIVSFYADIAWEIAEKKRSAEALAESEKKYRLLLDTANEAIIVAQEGKIKFMNRKTLELFRDYSAEEITRRPLMDFVYEDDRERVILNYNRRISGEPAEARYPFRINISGREIRWVEVNAVLIEWESKPATLNFFTDITDRKNIEDELKKSELFARAALDALTSNIAILDENGFIIEVNRAWREFAKSNTDDISRVCEGMNYLEVCDSAAGDNSAEARSAAEGIRSVMRGDQDEFTLEYPCHSPNEKRWFNLRVTRFAYEGAVRIAVAHENITKRKNVESELRLLSYVIEQSPVSIVITDKNGTMQYVNPAAEQTTGYRKDELIGQNPRILKSDYIKEHEYRMLWETITSGKYWKGEFHNVRKDGSLYWESATISPIFDEEGLIEQFAGIKEDITERKEAEARIQNLLVEKELILQEVHHRIKNNMNTIKGLLYLQAVELKDSSAAAALHEAVKRVQSMMILYDKLYNSHDFREVSLKSYLGPLVDEILENFQNYSIVKVNRDIGDFTIDSKFVFPLGIIVNELLTNIMKYAFTGRESGVISITASRDEKHIVVTLSDDGNGMPESINFDNSTGFGLNLVGMMTSQIDGNIRIERENGTKFVLEFSV